MNKLAILASFPMLNAPAEDAAQAVRHVGLLEDNSIAIAVGNAGAGTVTQEFAFALDRVGGLAERVLAGDSRALTQPGLARILAGTVVILIRQAAQAGRVVPIEAAGDEGEAAQE